MRPNHIDPGLLPRPGGGGMVEVVVEKKVRLGLAIMGVPSSSSSVGGGVMGWELSLWMAGPQVDVSVVLTAWMPEVEERA